MGLDMNLKVRNPLYESEKEAFDALKAIDSLPWKVYSGMSKSGLLPFVDVCYWRKANMVHNFLMECDGRWVDGFGGDDHDCGYKHIPNGEIDRLIEICKTIVEQGFEYDGKHHDTVTTCSVGLCSGEASFDADFARENLPTTEGFFFGSYSYDGYYLYDVAYTYEKLSALKEQGALDGDLYYCPWW